jgi:hypothetical protein
MFERKYLVTRLFVLCLLSPGLAYSQESSDKAIPDSCHAEVKSFCEKEQSPSGRIQCLAKNFKDLSYQCQQEINRLVRAVEQARAQTDDLISPSALSAINPPFTIFTLDARYSPNKDSQHEGRASISVPVLKTEDKTLALKAASTTTSFEEPIKISDTASVPKTLYKAETGFQYSQQLSGYRNVSLSSSIGYTGDQTMKNTTFSVMANYGYPTESGNFLIWSLFLSNNSPLGNYVPIPGIMYVYKTSTFTGLFGVPAISLQWTPAPEQAYSFSFMGVSANAEAAFGNIRRFQTYLATNWTTQSYILQDRTEDKDRLSLEEKRAGMGVRTFAFGRAQLQLEGGYAFDRSAYIGQGLRNMEKGSANIDSDIYLSLSIKAGF